jgi:hypothetical protein
MLFSICEFRENRHREGRTFLVGITNIASARVLETVLHFEIKNTLGKSVYCATEYTVCSFVNLS